MAVSSPLASRAPGSTLFFTNLLRLNRSPPMASATRYLVARSIRTGDPPDGPDEETVKRSLEYFELLESTKHPFIREGPPSPFFCLVQGDKAYTRVDMPGVGMEGLKFWQEKNSFVFQGVESIDEDDDEDEDEEEVEKRVYSEKVFFPVNVVKDSINVVIQNGVLRIVCRFNHIVDPY